MRAVNIKINGMTSPSGIDGTRIRVTWNDQGEGTQTAFQIIAEDTTDGHEICDSGKTEGNGLSYVLPKAIPWETSVRVMIRLWDDKEQTEDAAAQFETSLAPEDFKAAWISPERKDPTDKSGHPPAGYLRKRFFLPASGTAAGNSGTASRYSGTAASSTGTTAGSTGTALQSISRQHAAMLPQTAFRARLYATAHGLYIIYLNGQRVGDAVLTPGTAQYDKRQPYQTYDVTSLLKEGENEIIAVLGDGWYRSNSGVHGDRFVYGHDLSLLAQLVIRTPDHQADQTIATNKTWEAGSGPILMNDMQQGETFDARICPFQDRHAAREESFPKDIMLPSESVPIKEHERFRITLNSSKVISTNMVLHTPDGSTVLDFGQNLAGYIQIDIPHGKAGRRIRLICGETLDENGNFTNVNFHEDKQHETGGAAQTITYICKEGENHYKPSFTIMGFRYAKLELSTETGTKGHSIPEDLDGAVFTAIAVYSDMRVTAGFASSSPALNQLFTNSLWSMKSNFCDVPTDCPTRERAGWTGDAGLFAPTGVKLMDAIPVFRKWLSECRACQYPDGKVANIAPTTGKPSVFTSFLASSVGWGDACILVPLTLYHWTGDVADLAVNYDMMKRWYAFLEKRAAQIPSGKLLHHDPLEKYIIDTGLDYGEWCEPGSSAKEDMGHPNRAVSTGYFAYSGRLLAQIASILGKEDDAAHFQDVSNHAKEAFTRNFTDNGIVNSTHQADYVRALHFDLVPEGKKQYNADKLNQNVKGNGYHLNTGFLSTPYLCSTLARFGYVDTAYRVLLQESAPSWLYAVRKGATTIWERWDGIDAQNKVHASLNHYAYGAISGWLIGGVCGIQYKDGKITIAPIIPGSDISLTHAQAQLETYAGNILAGWRKEKGRIVIYGRIPDGQKAELLLPSGDHKELPAGEFKKTL